MKAFLRPWCLGAAMSALYALAIVLGFWRVLAPDVVFVAPDAPLAPLTFGEAVRQLFSTPPTLQNLVFLLPYRFAYEGTFWVDGYVMCLAAVFLLRGRGVGWGAAWVGGLCAAFAGYFATLFCAGHRGVVDALSVGCLGFGALLRGVRTGRVRWFALVAAANALSLAAQADIWLLVALAQGAYALWLLWRERPAWRPLARGAAVAAAVFLVVGWPALRHTFVDARQTRADQLAQAQAAAQSPAQAAAAQWRFITDWSLPPEDLVEWFLPGAIGHTSYPFDPKPYTGRIGSAHQTLRQHTVHVGWPAMLLAATAIVLLARRDPSARDLPFWYASAALALLLAMGVDPIADYCRIEPATVGSILTRMEEAGLVERRQKPGDRRALYVSLTAAGESAAEAVAQLFDRADRQASSLLTQAETEHLTALLEKVCAALPEEVIQG